MRSVLTMMQAMQKLDINDVADKALAQTEESYAEAQRDQMLHGISSTGGRIGTYRNPAYKAKKLAMNPLADGYVDLRLTGDFQQAVTAIADNEGMRVFSFDVKTNILQESYGDTIFLLAPLNKSAWINNRLAPATMTIVVAKLS